jgi:hypothetical protein|nr:MAG TPA: putative transcriptional regulator [Caudoviricetes sp.]
MGRNDRLKEAFEFLRSNGKVHTQKDLAVQMGATRPNVSGAFKGDPKILTDNFIKRFNNAFDDIFNLNWLLDGEGEMLNDTTNSNTQIKVTYEDRPRISHTSGRPYYNVDFIGGFDLVLNDQTIVPEYNIDFAPYNQDGVVWCNITGNSMQPKISHGDIIAIKEVVGWQDYLSMGEIYAVVTANHLRTVKIIRQGKSEGTLRFIPINTAEFDEQEVPIKMITRVFEVLGCMKRL